LSTRVETLDLLIVNLNLVFSLSCRYYSIQILNFKQFCLTARGDICNRKRYKDSIICNVSL